MDVGRMSMSMSQGALASAVQLSLMKMQMNTGEEMAAGMTDMLNNMAVDTTKGVNLDVKA